MRFFKITVKILISLLFIVIIGGIVYWQQQKPVYNGNITLDVSEKVAVYFDTIGVPHIYANNQKDAYVALGYVHAQERLWQMELMRRISAGRLSEILGKDLIEVDKFFLSLGVDDAAEKDIKKLNKNAPSFMLTQAYLDGINQFIDNGPTPLEFTLAGVTKEHYTIKDIYNVFGYMSFSFAMAHKTDPLLSTLKAKLDIAYLTDLSIDIEPNAAMIPNFNLEEINEQNMTSKIDAIMDKVPVSPFIGSNAWVVGAKKTANGKVIFSNDPHIKYSQPGVWYQSHIVCPDYELYGFNLALTPFSLLGHNRDFAYGLTMFENDDVDFYAEEINPKDATQYRVGENYLTFSSVTKTIKVKDSEDISYEIKSSIHGPIMNAFIGYEDSDKAIAMDWIYTKFPNETTEAMYQISHATSLEAFKEGVSKIVAPGLNVMYGDAKDNIAWFAAAKLYQHDNLVHTKFILDGSNTVDDKISYIDFKDNPQAINPTWNYVYSANNQPEKILDSILYPGYYLPEDRAKRIMNSLDDKKNIKLSDMKTLITDVTSSKAAGLVKIILQNIDKQNLSPKEQVAFEVLESWKGNFDINEVAPTIYTKFKYLYLKNIFADEMGDEIFKQFIVIHIGKRQFAKQIQTSNSIWNDDINTKNIKESNKQIIIKSFTQAIFDLEEQFKGDVSKWTWGKVHTLENGHAIGDKVDLLRGFLNVGPFPISGTNEVLNNQLFSINESGIYKVGGGPSTRRIVDFSNIDNSVAIVPTGQSGNVFSKHYKDQAEKFINNEFYPMLINKEKIMQLDNKLVINPK